MNYPLLNQKPQNVVSKWLSRLQRAAKSNSAVSYAPLFDKGRKHSWTPMLFPSREVIESCISIERSIGDMKECSKPKVYVTLHKGFIQRTLYEELFDLANCNYHASSYAHYIVNFRDDTGAKLVFSLHNFIYNDESHLRLALLRDIFVEQKGNGYGGQMLDRFIELCYVVNAQYIQGIFAPEKGKSEDLDRFYRRHGFDIKSWGDSKIIVRKNFS